MMMILSAKLGQLFCVSGQPNWQATQFCVYEVDCLLMF